ASAIGYYGDRGEETLDESSPKGEGFLADVATLWEKSTAEVESLGTRRAVIRTALVLARDAEFIRRITLPFKLFVGGPQGGGGQWTSWIHIEDEARAIVFLLERPDLSGIFNLASPDTVRNKELARAIGRVMRRPAMVGVPAVILKAAFGEMAGDLMLASQKVMPKRLLESGFTFAYADIDAALEEVLAGAEGRAGKE
ncbi:MAG TPA: TIGR01777 family protein, partial [Candidatus Eisenbacteria bacterium]|nr:TIGR01777 family protein [Candidatus Eisenbacteria bacterium]